MSRLKRRLLQVLVATPVAITGMAGAAETAREPVATLEEVTVTARKFAENLQEVPLAISALTAQDLERSNINALWDLMSRAPSLQYFQFNIGLPRYYMRGIGSDSRSGASDPDVGVFADDVYIGRASGTSGDFLDLERIEILRGPQGTLFGRNVVGGAVATFSQKPTREFEWSTKLTAGNYRRFSGEAMLNVPVSDKWALRFAAKQQSQSGYAHNSLSGSDLDDENRLSTRASALYTPSDEFSLLLRAEYGRDRALGQWWDFAVPSEFAAPFVNPDRRSGDNPEDGFNRRQDRNVTATVNWTTGIGTLTSISAYRSSAYDSRENTTSLVVPPLDDPTPGFYTLFIQQQDQAATQYSQEFRLSGSPVEALKVVAGAYYLHEKVERTGFTDYRFTFYGAEGRGGWTSQSRLNSYAVFGQGTWSFADRWRLTGGLRWTRDDRAVDVQTLGTHYSGSFRDHGARVPGWTGSASAGWSNWTPMLSLSYLPRPDVTLFATASRGFKSGGFDDANREKQAVINPFNPELAWDYELGVKSELLQHRLRMNANLYYVDYKDLQVSLISQPDPNLPPFGVAGNAGKAKIYGVELDFEFVVTPQMTIYGNYAVNHNRLRNIVVDGEPLPEVKLPFAPKQKGSAGATYTVPSRIGSWTLRTDVSYQTDQFVDVNNTPSTLIKGYGLVDAGIAWLSNEENLKVELWGKNLGDRLYWVAASEVPPGDVFVKYGPPRTYGVTAEYRFK